jgi:diguanylate cyclase (GGDEF)-like protein/PAS domain S-box-containing protein
MNEFMDQYQQLVELAPAGIFYTDLSGLCTYTNRAWQDMFQLSFNDALQSGWTQRLHPDEAKGLIKSWNLTIQKQQAIRSHCRLALPDGQVRYIQTDANIVRNSKGVPQGYIGFVLDVSRSKHTEQQLQESESRAHAIIEQSRIPYAVRDEQDKIAYLNPAFTHTFGYTLKDIPTSHDWFLKAYPDKAYRQKILYLWHKTIDYLGHNNHQIEPLEVQISCKDGSVKTVQLSPIHLRDSEGDKYAVSLYDITEIKKVEHSLKESEERFSLAVNSGNVGIWDWDLRTGHVFYAKELKLEMGYQDHEFTNDGDAFYSHMHPDDTDGVKNAVALHFKSDIIPYRVQYRMRHKNGEYQWYQAVGKALKDKNGKAYRMAGSQINITEQMLTNERINLANTVFEQSSEAILITDNKGKIEAINPAFCLLTGYEQDYIINESYLRLNSTKNEPALIKQIYRALIKKSCWSGELWSCNKAGDDFAVSIMINAVKDDNDKKIRYIALFTDITVQKNTQELIWKQAHYDNLTQLFNRHSFTQYLQKSVKSRQPFSLLFIDLDHFKQINDTLGHKTGDELLIQAAARITLCVRASDIVARFGGDEFTVILTGINNVSSIKRISHDIIRQLAKPFKLDDETAYISASIGITQYPMDSLVVEDLYKYADQAMYDAKRLGRNRFAFFTQKMQENANKQRKIGADLRIALEKHQFKVLYQPIINLKTGQIYKAEALIRWHHPTKGIISPADFIPIAEDTGLIIEIGTGFLNKRRCKPKCGVSSTIQIFR